MTEQVAGALAQLTAAAFAGSCAYIALVQQPVRAALPPRAALDDVRATLPRAERLQAPLLVVALLAVAVQTAAEPSGTTGTAGLLLLAVLGQTVLRVLPLNRRLLSGAPADHLEEAPGMVRRWGRLHAARTVLAVAAAALLASG